MPNWAIVIGIDRYADAGMSLKGAVRDAIQMAAYLTSGDTPLVEPGRVKCLLSRTAASPVPPDSLKADEATLENIFAALQDIATKPAGRLFVHFSGHGFLAEGLGGGESLAPADFKKASPLSIRLDSVRDFLRTTRFDEQVLFVDACRNIPAVTFKVNPIAIDTDVHAMRPQVRQYVFCATLRGLTAAESGTPNDERGVFTQPLIRGLRGEGAAKTFNEEEDGYRVTVGRLLRFVSGEVRRTVQALPGQPPDGTATPQEPRLVGEIDDTEAVLVRLKKTDVGLVNLRLAVTPAEAAADATVFIRADDETSEGPPITADTTVALLPKDYRVVVRAEGFAPVKPSWPALLYSDMQLNMAMHPSAAAAAPATRGGLRGLEVEPTTLELSSTNPLTVVRLLDAAGRVVATGKETVVVRDIEPGVYQGQVVASDGTVVERTIVVDEGASQRLVVDAPPPPALLIGDFVESRQALRSGQAAGSMHETIDAHRIEEASVRLLTTEVRRLDPEPRHLARSYPFAPACYAVTATVLSRPVTIVLPILPEWNTNWIVDTRADRRGASVVAFVRTDGSGKRQLDAIEIAQRYYQKGLLASAIEVIGKEVDDPMALLIVAYSRLRQELSAAPRAVMANRGKAHAQLRDSVGLLNARFPHLSDAKFIQFEASLLAGAGAAVDLCKAALDLGAPLFAFGAQRLLGHAKTFAIEHPRLTLLETAIRKKVAAWPWTAWISEKEPPTER